MRLCFFADSCTLLDAFGGSLLGRQCPTTKAVGPNDGVFLGGQCFDIQVLSHRCYEHVLSYIYTSHTYVNIHTHVHVYTCSSGFNFNLYCPRDLAQHVNSRFEASLKHYACNLTLRKMNAHV